MIGRFSAANHFSIFSICIIHNVIAVYDVLAAFHPGFGIKLYFIQPAIIFNALSTTLYIFVFAFTFLLECTRVSKRSAMLKAFLVFTYDQLVRMNNQCAFC